MLRTKRDSTAASRYQFGQALVGHWIKSKAGSNAAWSKANGVDVTADTLIWVWSLQPEAGGKDLLCA